MHHFAIQTQKTIIKAMNYMENGMHLRKNKKNFIITSYVKINIWN